MRRLLSRHEPAGPDPEHLELVLVDGTGALALKLAEAYPEAEVTSVDHVDDAIKRAMSGRPTVALIGPAEVGDVTLARLEQVLRGRAAPPQFGAVLLVDRLAAPMLRRAMRAGISDVLGTNASTAELQEAIDRTLEAFDSPASASAGDGNEGRMVAVFSPKGGTGTTTLAINLAAAMKGTRRPNVLLDADLPFGDIAVNLGIDPTHSLADAMGADLDEARLQTSLLRHDPAGLLALVGPPDPARAELITGASVARVIDLLRLMTDVIIVDTASAFDDVTLAVLERADEIVLVTGCDVASVKNAKVARHTLHLLEIPEARIHLAINRVPARGLLSVADVEKALGPASCVIPDDAAVGRASHEGTAVVLDAPKSPAARAFTRLAERILARTSTANAE